METSSSASASHPCRCSARFSVYRPVGVDEFDAFREFYNAVAKDDTVQLMFITK